VCRGVGVFTIRMCLYDIVLVHIACTEQRTKSESRFILEKEMCSLVTSLLILFNDGFRIMGVEKFICFFFESFSFLDVCAYCAIRCEKGALLLL